MKRLLYVFLFFAISLSSAQAYILTPPSIQVVASVDGSTILRIDPGSWLPKPGEEVWHARATVFNFDEKRKIYTAGHSFILRNPVAPTTAVVANGGKYIVTLDDWDDMVGCTENVVVVYRGNGELVKSWRLEDIFSREEIEKFGPFPINAPTRRWRGDKVQIYTNDGKVYVNIPWNRELSWHVGLQLDLQNLTFKKSISP